MPTGFHALVLARYWLYTCMDELTVSCLYLLSVSLSASHPAAVLARLGIRGAAEFHVASRHGKLWRVRRRRQGVARQEQGREDVAVQAQAFRFGGSPSQYSNFSTIFAQGSTGLGGELIYDTPTGPAITIGYTTRPQTTTKLRRTRGALHVGDDVIAVACATACRQTLGK